MTGKLNRRIFTGGLIGKTQEQLSECHLWRAVLSQAISDAYLNEPKERDVIEVWIHSDDFITVCDFADIDYHKMKIILFIFLKPKNLLQDMKVEN